MPVYNVTSCRMRILIERHSDMQFWDRRLPDKLRRGSSMLQAMRPVCAATTALEPVLPSSYARLTALTDRLPFCTTLS